MRETLWESKGKWHEKREKQELPERQGQRSVAQRGRAKKERDKDKKKEQMTRR
jgi:hypothetical protein